MRYMRFMALALAGSLVASACSDDGTSGDDADVTTQAPDSDEGASEPSNGSDFEGMAAWLNGEEEEVGVTADELATRYEDYDCSLDTLTASVIPPPETFGDLVAESLFDIDELAVTYFVCGADVADDVIARLPADQQDDAETIVESLERWYVSD